MSELLKMLRCPHCVTRGKKGFLMFSGKWFICKEPDCQRKYPVYKGIPIMLTREGDFYHYKRALEKADIKGSNNG
ncbi:MAG TPA: hypothetical protein DCP53_00345 [Elusimicrobia bacterium]|nr:hypothetical protein [Elusimicrobiota bacterium]